MTISTVLKTIYASAPASVVRLQTLEIELPGAQSVRLVGDYEDHLLGVNGAMQSFEACGIDISLPARDTSGNQALQFAIGLLDRRADRMVQDALESGEAVYLTYREYLSSDKSAPAAAPIRMSVVGGEFRTEALAIEASYFDLLNTAYPRDRYTVEAAPGVKYL